MRLFLSHRIITTFASGNSVVSFRYSFSPRNLLLQVAFIERESQYGSCSLSRFVERGGRRKMFERFNVVPPARVLPVQNSQGTVSCRGSVLIKSAFVQQQETLTIAAALKDCYAAPKNPFRPSKFPPRPIKTPPENTTS